MTRMGTTVEEMWWLRGQAGTVVVAVLAVLGGGCASDATGEKDQAQAGSSAAVTGALTDAPDGWLPGDPCDPATDGWRPEPLPAPEPGEILISVPPGHKSRAAIGEPYCALVNDIGIGLWNADCRTDADCPKGAICPVNVGVCVTPCSTNTDCEGGACAFGRISGVDGEDVPFCWCRKRNCDESLDRASIPPTM